MTTTTRSIRFTEEEAAEIAAALSYAIESSVEIIEDMEEDEEPDAITLQMIADRQRDLTAARSAREKIQAARR